MLDIHAVTGTPGAVLVRANLATIAVNDFAVVAGVPLQPGARLILWGSNSLIANTIAATQLICQDCIDPINGEYISLGSASLQNQAYKFTNIPYKTGARVISQGTNTAQTATSQGFTLDYYEGGNVMDGRGLRFASNAIALPQVCNADVAITWTATGFAPATAIPNGKYALLGAYVTKTTEAHVIRFQHADFGQFFPGFPSVDHAASAILGFQKGMKDPLATDPGYQFVALSEMLGKPCVPVFKVTNAGTGLNILSLAAAATDTPSITLNLCRVGE